MTGEKLVTNAVFGNLEYYLGMVAGVVRFACILLFGLALLNAPIVTDKELEDFFRAELEAHRRERRAKSA